MGGIIVPLINEMIRWIEDHRNGEPKFFLYVEALLAPVIEKDEAVLGKPWLQPVEYRNSSSYRDKIPLSEWIKHLKSLGWDETQLIEVPGGLQSQAYPQAGRRFDEAIDHFRRGDWEETLAACRKAIEVLAAVKTPDGAAKPDMKRLRAYFEVGKKGDVLDKMLTEFGNFLHLGRHEQPMDKPVKITRADALASLTITSAFLRYVS